MTKSKVGAEPKKQRVRHAITKSEVYLKKQTQKILIIQLVFMKERLMKFLMNY